MADRNILTAPVPILNALFHLRRVFSATPSIILDIPSNSIPKPINAINTSVAARGKAIAAIPITITAIPKPISTNFLFPLTNEIVTFSIPTIISTADRIITNEIVAIVGNINTTPDNIIDKSPRII